MLWYSPSAEHEVEESDSNIETIEREFLDVNSGERIAQFEKVQGSLTVTVGPQEEEQDSCHMDKWESDMFEITSKYPPVGRVHGTG